MEASLEKIRSLEQIYIKGYEDRFLDNALQKIISHQLARDQADLQVLQQDLAELERKYGISSEEFYERFQAGQLITSRVVADYQIVKERTTATDCIAAGTARPITLSCPISRTTSIREVRRM